MCLLAYACYKVPLLNYSNGNKDIPRISQLVLTILAIFDEKNIFYLNF